MYLLEVYQHSIFWSNPELFKRRLSNDVSSIEEWINDNAPKWTNVPVQVEHDGHGNGKVYLPGCSDSPMYTFQTSNISVI